MGIPRQEARKKGQDPIDRQEISGMRKPKKRIR